MKTLLYIVRHGQSLKNVEKITQGHTHDDINGLSELGRSQATELSKRLSKVQFYHCYSSPFKRAGQTASLIIDKDDVQISIDNRLVEKHQGESIGKSVKDTLEAYVDWDVITEEERMDRKQFVGEESQRELRSRVLEVVNEIARNNVGHNILVVTHGGFMRSLYSYLENKSYKEMWKFDNCGYMVVECSNGKLKVLDIQGLKQVNREDLY